LALYDGTRLAGRHPHHAAVCQQFARLQEDLRLAGLRDHADKDADFGVPPDAPLHQNVKPRGVLTPIGTAKACFR
jgi:hypothetical protein